MHDKAPKKERLNQDLCPDKFEICVPKSCQLLGQGWDDACVWKEYVRSLDPECELPEDYEPETCYTCDCKEGWVLHGKLAEIHACRVHDKIHRQVLGFEKVSAVDVGFAIWERQSRFENFLSIRVHVNQKLPPEQLLRAGLPNLSEPIFALDRSERARLFVAGRPGEDKGGNAGGPQTGRSACRNSLRWRSLVALVKELLGGKPKTLIRLGDFPISGVRIDDLSIFCRPEVIEIQSLDDIRLSICGVPIDIINAQYNPAVAHPGGDADRGIFADAPRPSVQLKDGEHLLIGRGRVNPLVGGVSIGSVTSQAGTIGTVVWDRTDGTPCVLGNWHVLAGTGTAQVGQPAYQPALFDGGTEDDVVAHLKRWVLGEEGDAAISELSGSRHYASGEILGLWHPISGYLTPQLNLEIRKWGRTTGFTQGFVDGIHLATNIDYGNGVVRYFTDQFHIAPLYPNEDVSQVGDSGSLVVTSFKPLGLQQDLADLERWLRACCAVGSAGQLCSDIREEGKILTDRCYENCSRHLCKGLRKEIKVIQYLCDKDRYDELRKRIKEVSRQYLWDLSKGVRDCARFCERVDETFEGWQLAAEKKYLKVREICDKIQEEGRKFEKECPAQDCQPICNLFSKALRKLSKLCKTQPSRRKLEKLIKKQRKALRYACEPILRCSGVFKDADKILKEWAKRSAQIIDGIEVCQILDNTCNESTCQSPSGLVECIKKALAAQRRSTEDSNPGNITTRHLCDISEEEFTWLFERYIKKFSAGNPGPSNDWFGLLLKDRLQQPDVLDTVIRQARELFAERTDRASRKTIRVYYAVGMIFAGDTPGSPFGEFAVASDIQRIAEKLRFDLHPVFEPRSSFRELRVRPQPSTRGARPQGSGTGLAPGDQGADQRGGGPQPDLEPSQTSSENRLGGG